jgi:uncharacterized integral membrane protein (TIGR00697 family)
VEAKPIIDQPRALRPTDPKKRQQALTLYVALAGLFIASLVTCNLVANKFVTVDLGFTEFILSAGVLAYPLTFLITDLLSELFGRELTNKVIFSGFGALALVLIILQLGGYFNAIDSSPVGDDVYSQVFANSWRVIFASTVAYLLAQLVDVRLFHFWKRLTNGRHLWLRNNASTILSQLVDTTLVVSVLFIGVEPINKILLFILHGWLFKMLCALIDTPLLYLTVWAGRKKFNLAQNQELKLS